jgi:hypothetical protein
LLGNENDLTCQYQKISDDRTLYGGSMITTKNLAAQFSSKENSMVKKALLCRTGSFDGMNGEVTVTKEMLEDLCDTYVNQKINPTNDNDFAPILIDHERKTENVMGRLLPDNLEVKEWKEINGEMEYGLFGDLRIDDLDAQAKVGTGKYAHLSISFDEDSNEIFEVSFVAVEAARGSIVLANNSTGGKKMNLEKKFSNLSQKHTALAAKVKLARTKRQKALSALITKKTDVQKEVTALMSKTGEIAKAIKASQLKAQFSEFVRQGKMNPAELKEIDFSELAAMTDSARKILLSSYEKRPVSTDIFQYGQGSDKKAALSMSPAAVRERMELQRSGKGAELAEQMPEKEMPKKEMGEGEGDKDDSKKMYAMSEDEHAKHMEDMMECHKMLGECVEKIKSMGMDAEKMSDDDMKDEKKEMADESDSEDMSADDEKNEPPPKKDEAK